MAQRSQSHPDNVPGSFFVDRTCIDCGTCYEYLPWVFQDAGGHSRVHRQPAGPSDHFHALKALLACPTGSIGADAKAGLKEAQEGFPDPIEEEVSFCGFTSPKSFGAWSYFIRRPGGNVLVDSPRAVPVLLDRLERLGGVALMVLSHRDDVADHERFHQRFGCARVLHRADLGEGIREVERAVDGDEPVRLAPDLLYLPTPGHTPGSACLLYRNSTCSAATTCGGTRTGACSPPPRPTAGTTGPPSSRAWSACWTMTSPGCSRATAPPTGREAPRPCAGTWRRRSPGSGGSELPHPARPAPAPDRRGEENSPLRRAGPGGNGFNDYV